MVNPVKSSFKPKKGTPSVQSVQYKDPMFLLLIPSGAQGQSLLIGPTLLPKHVKQPLISHSKHVS
jgi:hypothetical protein